MWTPAISRLLKENRVRPRNGRAAVLRLELRRPPGTRRRRMGRATSPARRRPPGLPANYIRDRSELDDLTSYFAWAAWATVANRPGKDYSYTNNWPYEPAVGNRPSSSTYLWSALSLVTLLAGLGAVLFAVGRFDFLGWHAPSATGHFHDSALARGRFTAEPEARRASTSASSRSFSCSRLSPEEPSPTTVLSRGPSTGSISRVPPLQPSAHVAPAARDLLDRHGLGRRRPLPCADRRRRGAPRAEARASCAAAGRPRRRCLRQPLAASTSASTTAWASSGSGWATRARSTWTSGASGSSFWRPVSRFWLVLMYRALRPAIRDAAAIRVDLAIPVCGGGDPALLPARALLRPPHQLRRHR